jgi:subtilisin family serine protease
VGVWSTTAFDGYWSYNGTSMATPHVTGAAALYASTHPGASAAQVKSALLDSTVPTASLEGKTVPGGRLNASGF